MAAARLGLCLVAVTATSALVFTTRVIGCEHRIAAAAPPATVCTMSDAPNSDECLGDIRAQLDSIDVDAQLAADDTVLDVDALKLGLAKLKLQEAEDDAQQWKAAFGDSAEISDASGAEDGDDGFEVVGTF